MLTKTQKARLVIALEGVLIGIILKTTIISTSPIIVGIGIISLLFISAQITKGIMNNDKNSYS